MYFSYNSACGIYSLQYLLTLLMLFIWIFTVQSLLYWHIYSIYVSGESGAGKFHLVSRTLTGHLAAAGSSTNQEVYQTGTWRHGPLQYSLDEAIMSQNVWRL